MKKKVFKIELIGAENSEIITKFPASADDVVAALHFLDDTTELHVSLCYCEFDPQTGAPIV